MKSKFSILILLIGHHAWALPKAETCYENLGCFTTEFPWTSDVRPQAVLPEPPSVVGTKFRLMKLLSDGSTLDYYVMLADDDFNFGNSGFDVIKKTVVLVHDWTHSSDASWVQRASRSLLLQGEKNVLAVDWRNGAGYPYLRALGNSQLVGAEIARMLQFLTNKGILASDIHIIGHGLGAQAAAFTASRYSGIQRITGLDPARVYYEGADPVVRLDESDAVLVDVIHSDRPTNRHVGLGFTTNTGHVDFFPNDATEQPGCSDRIDNYVGNDEQLLSATISGNIEDFACSHLRSTEYFVDSLSPDYRCVFTAVPCPSWTAFAGGNCYQACTSGRCSNMGYYADLERGNGTLYLSTFDKAPYCVRNVKFQVDVALTQESTKGSVRAIVVGNVGQTGELQLTDSDILAGFILTGSTNVHGAGPLALGDIIGLQLRYDQGGLVGIGSTKTLQLSRAFVQAPTVSAESVTTSFNGLTLEDGVWTALTAN